MLGNKFENKKILVIGMGVSGRSAARFLHTLGAFVLGVDRDADRLNELPEMCLLKQQGVEIRSDDFGPQLSLFDYVVLSPGISPFHPLVQAAKEASLPIMGEIELGCLLVSNPIVGITGTNGKTTVALMVSHIFNQCGYPASALGNVGKPLTEGLLTISTQSSIILELSSYQLETMHQRVLDSAIILNITPDHLDRYQNMCEYAKAKLKIGKNLKCGSPFYINEETWEKYGHLVPELSPFLFGYNENSYIYTDLNAVFRNGKKVFELPLPLKNKKSVDLENFLAAYALCADKEIPGEAFLGAWKIFEKPSHRIEYVSEYKGVKYFDDSKGTNVDAVSRAVESIEGPIILIAGGVDKGSSYTVWVEKFKDKVKLICTIGQAAAKIEAQLSPFIPVTRLNTLEEAVLEAAKNSERGDTVLLSPGCASFDMFRDYAHRGEEFQRIVRSIAGNGIR